MASQSLTLDLPQPIFKHLQEIAAATQQSLEQVALQSLEGNLPPTVANAPPEMQAELLALQTLSVEELKQIATHQIPPVQQARHFALLEKNKGEITSEERLELAELRMEADRLMLRKAYAWAVLRWRGQSIPALNELPLD